MNVFTRYTGDRAARLDKMLGVDYDLYHALNMQAQRAALKSLDMQKRITSSIPRESKLSSKNMNSMYSVRSPKDEMYGSPKLSGSPDISAPNVSHHFSYPSSLTCLSLL